MLKQFPSTDDRQHIHSLINDQAHGKCSRDDMMRWVAHIIGKYSLERIPVFGYSVRILDYYNDLPIISIEGAEVSGSCPACHSGIEHARYLRTEAEHFDRDYDEASYTCLECGCVYISKQPNGRRVNHNGRVLN